MFDRELLAALALCALGLAVAGAAAARPERPPTTLSQVGAPMVTVLVTAKERPGPLAEAGPIR